MSLTRIKKRLTKIGDKISSPENSPTPSTHSPVPTSPQSANAFVFLPQGLAAAPSQRGRAPKSWPINVPILPKDGLQALVFHHTIDTPVSGIIYCWTYISQGMRKIGQKELVFTVRRRQGPEGEGNYPPDPFRWFEMVYTRAKMGEIVDEFQHTDFRSPDFFGRDDVRWMVYASQCPMGNVPANYLPSEWLLLVPLLELEAEVAERFGIMRTLSHLGASQRWFPWPSWFDRDRPPCVLPSQMEGSIRGQVSYAIIPGISAVKKGSTFVLYIPEKAESGIQQALGTFQPSHALPLDCVPYKDADSGLLWCNTDTEPRGYAIGTSNSCMNLNFFTFCPGQDVNEFKLVEDGYVFLLKNDTWMHIRQQLGTSSPVAVSVPSGEVFLVEYSRHGNTNSGVSVFTPTTPRATISKPWHVHCDHIVMLDNNVTDPADADPIAEYVKRIESVMDALVPRTAPPGTVGGGRVAIEADVGGPDRWDRLGRRWITIHFTPSALEVLPLDDMQDKLTALDAPDIEPRTRFQVMFNVWGYRGQ